MSRRATRTYGRKNKKRGGGGGRGSTAPAAKKKNKKNSEIDFDIWLEEEDPDFAPPELEPEHDSVESIDPDDDENDDVKLSVSHRPLSPPPAKRTPSKRLAHLSDPYDGDDKGKEEADAASPELSGGRPKRQRKRRARRASNSFAFAFDDEGDDDDDDDHQDGLILSPASDDDGGGDDVYEAAQPDEPRTEVVTLDEITQAATVNVAYLNALVGVATYLRGIGAQWPEQLIHQVESDMQSTIHALRDCPLPITQAAPIEHAVPPTIPAADGTEVRFTNVAQSLGIVWRDVPEEQKLALYDRAVQLHYDHFGCYPKKVLMHTNTGRRGVYLYTEATFRPTMLRALHEFKRRQEQVKAAAAAGLEPVN